MDSVPVKRCSVEGCQKPHIAKGYCATHYDRLRNRGTLEPIKRPEIPVRHCSVNGCEGKYKARGWCSKHYDRWLTHGSLAEPVRPQGCKVDGCDKKHCGKGFCEKHYRYEWNKNRRPYKPCSRDGCDKTVIAKNLCSYHYANQRHLEKMAANPPLTTFQRFEAKVNKDGPVSELIGTKCWLWVGATKRDGYSSFRFEGKTSGAHIYSYRHFKGEIPKGLEIDHLCFVRNCVNPEHLEAVTTSENVLRSFRRGKRKSAKGRKRGT